MVRGDEGIGKTEADEAAGRAGHQAQRCSSTVTQVPSVPTKARATLKPFSGSSSSRL